MSVSAYELLLKDNHGTGGWKLAWTGSGTDTSGGAVSNATGRAQSITITNTIDVYINLLRRKLEKPGQQPLIHTFRGVGYSLREET